MTDQTMLKLFKNKTALITGASKGIGEATARHFGELGAQVILCARNVSALEKISAQIPNSHFIACDVSKEQDVKQAVDLAIKKTGRLDILVNNAGILDPVARITDSKSADWEKVIQVNVNGVYYGLKHAIKAMLKNDNGGTIINMSSGAARSALEGWSHYCCSKAAVFSLTQCAHKEYADHNIRVIGLSPGTVATHMQKAIKESGVNPVSQLDWDTHIPPQWVAQALAFLCGEGGDPYKGQDFSLKTNEGRKAVGLPLINT